MNFSNRILLKMPNYMSKYRAQTVQYISILIQVYFNDLWIKTVFFININIYACFQLMPL